MDRGAGCDVRLRGWGGGCGIEEFAADVEGAEALVGVGFDEEAEGFGAAWGGDGHGDGDGAVGPADGVAGYGGEGAAFEAGGEQVAGFREADEGEEQSGLESAVVGGLPVEFAAGDVGGELGGAGVGVAGEGVNGEGESVEWDGGGGGDGEVGDGRLGGVGVGL